MNLKYVWMAYFTTFQYLGVHTHLGISFLKGRILLDEVIWDFLHWIFWQGLWRSSSPFICSVQKWLEREQIFLGWYLYCNSSSSVRCMNCFLLSLASCWGNNNWLFWQLRNVIVSAELKQGTLCKHFHLYRMQSSLDDFSHPVVSGAKLLQRGRSQWECLDCQGNWTDPLLRVVD